MSCGVSTQLDDLISSGRVRLHPGASLGAVPWSDDARPCAERWRGMFLGLAIGDGLGNTSEFMMPALRRNSHGEIAHYLPNRFAAWKRVGLPSDDTQLCAWAVEQILRDGFFEPVAWLDVVASRQVFGIGGTVRAALREYARGHAWPEAAREAAGNGALMRCPGIFAAHLGTDGRGLAADAALFAAATHNDFAAISSAVAFTLMLAELLTMVAPPTTDWWVARYIDLAAPLEGSETTYEGRGAPAARGYAGPLWRFVAEQVPAALAADAGTLAACDSCTPVPICWKRCPACSTSWPGTERIRPKRSGAPSTTPGTTTPSLRLWVPPWVPCTAKRRCQRNGTATCLVARARATTVHCTNCSTALPPT